MPRSPIHPGHRCVHGSRANADHRRTWRRRCTWQLGAPGTRAHLRPTTCWTQAYSRTRVHLEPAYPWVPGIPIDFTGVPPNSSLFLFCQRCRNLLSARLLLAMAARSLANALARPWEVTVLKGVQRARRGPGSGGGKMIEDLQCSIKLGLRASGGTLTRKEALKAKHVGFVRFKIPTEAIRSTLLHDF